MLILLEGVAAFEVEPDFGLDITAVDTTLGDEDFNVFILKTKEMTHGGFDMMRLFFNFHFVYFVFLFLND